MNALWEGIFAGFILACASSVAIALAFFFSRSYRQANNRVVIHVAQVVAAAVIVSLLLMPVVERWLGVMRHSTAYYAIRWAYIAPLVCSTIFILRADFRWQQSVGMYKKVAERL
jgi:hypothetical protein